MDVPVEAQSLSSLQYLLANPPQYPRNPTHEVRKPLVLYIVRVPGSKDVFLTPLKPPTKASISLEAIQSSLYYLHVESPDDEVLRRSIDHEKENFKVNDALPHIQRKPVPPLKKADLLNDPSQTRSVAEANPLARKARGDQESMQRLDSVDSTTFEKILRKPLGPRNPSNMSTSGNVDQKVDVLSPVMVDDTRHWVTGNGVHRGPHDESEMVDRHNNAIPPPLPDRSYRQSAEPGRSQPLSIKRYDSGSPVKLDRPCSKITLIRRDPASGAQWNVGTITELDKPSESNLKPFAVELNTPGYSKFLSQADLPTRMESHTTDPAAIKKMMMAVIDSQELATAATASRQDQSFLRTVAFRQQPQPASKQPTRLQNRTNSGDSFMNYPIHNNRPPRSVFSFTSPWQGLCMFLNGIDGRSLKCRHLLSRSSSSPIEDESSTASLAELRFNLPWAAIGARERGRDGGRSPSSIEREADTLPISKLLTDRPNGSRDAVRRSFQHIKSMSRDFRDTHLRSSSVDDPSVDQDILRTDAPRNHAPFSEPPTHRRENLPLSAATEADSQHPDTERLSLRLGREKAGGGFRGNSAKLGKLILENEGLKMGDLVVAACMGVWWQHYETSGP